MEFLTLFSYFNFLKLNIIKTIERNFKKNLEKIDKKNTLDFDLNDLNFIIYILKNKSFIRTLFLFDLFKPWKMII